MLLVSQSGILAAVKCWILPKQKTLGPVSPQHPQVGHVAPLCKVIPSLYMLKRSFLLLVLVSIGKNEKKKGHKEELWHTSWSYLTEWFFWSLTIIDFWFLSFTFLQQLTFLPTVQRKRRTLTNIQCQLVRAIKTLFPLMITLKITSWGLLRPPRVGLFLNILQANVSLNFEEKKKRRKKEKQ